MQARQPRSATWLAIAAVLLALAGAALTFMELVVLAMATSHSGLAGPTMIRQRLLAAACAGIGVVVAVTSLAVRRLSVRRRSTLLLLVVVSLVGGMALVWLDSRAWDWRSLGLAAFATIPLVACAGVALPSWVRFGRNPSRAKMSTP